MPPLLIMLPVIILLAVNKVPPPNPRSLFKEVFGLTIIVPAILVVLVDRFAQKMVITSDKVLLNCNVEVASIFSMSGWAAY